MSVTSRVLPVEEWPRLIGTDLEPFCPYLNPAQTRIVVVEEDGVIVAHWAVVQWVHAEGAWVREDRRKHAGVARALLRGMHEAARAFGARAVMTGAETPDIEQLIEAHLQGEKVTFPQYVVPVGE